MKRLTEKTKHLIYLWSLFFKTIVSIGELIFGSFFLLFSYNNLYSFISYIFGEEINESPRDFIFDFTMKIFHSFASTPQSVWAFIFLSHGIVKIILLYGLWRDKMWAYPLSIIIFTLFVFYQSYQMMITPSIIMLFITIIDIAVILLIIREYRHKKNIAYIL